jgi:hypothetical protein
MSTLAAASSIYTVVYFFAYVSDWLTQIAADGYFHFMPVFDTAVSLVAIGYSIFVTIRCRGMKCAPCYFTRMATIFLAVSSLGIAAQSWGWESEGLAARFSMESVDWVGVWLVAFPAIVALPPRAVLIASLMPRHRAGCSYFGHRARVPEEAGNLPWVAVARHTIPVFLAGLRTPSRTACSAWPDVSKPAAWAATNSAEIGEVAWAGVEGTIACSPDPPR